MWNQFLNEARAQQKLQNTPVLVLGAKHSGKRSLIDSLFDISKTSIYNKKLAGQADSNKMRLKGLTTAIDYAYLNVLDLSDVDNRTHTKLEVYMLEENDNPSIFSQLAKKSILQKAVILLMLDFTNPWTFEAELNQWIKFIYQLQTQAQFTISQLEQMAQRVEKVYTQFKDPQFDESGKFKKKMHFEQVEGEEQVELPVPEGALQNNIRMPFIICVNKCDLQFSVLRDESSNKIMFILHHLRKICLKYGGSLIYTSIKNNSNLSLLYEYILHRSYNMPLKHKSESINEEGIFIPLGFDNPTLLSDSVMNLDVSRSYESVIPAPTQKIAPKEEITVEDESKFFEKYSHTAVNANTSIESKTTTNSTDKGNEARNFFETLMKTTNNTNANIRNTTKKD